MIAPVREVPDAAGFQGPAYRLRVLVFQIPPRDWIGTGNGQADTLGLPAPWTAAIVWWQDRCSESQSRCRPLDSRPRDGVDSAIARQATVTTQM